jgi:hypothetical protein
MQAIFKTILMKIVKSDLNQKNQIFKNKIAIYIYPAGTAIYSVMSWLHHYIIIKMVS